MNAFRHPVTTGLVCAFLFNIVGLTGYSVVIYGEGINSHNAMIYLNTNFVLCVVPITKRLPLSITRFYVYEWNTEIPSWTYDKIVWTLSITDD